MCFLRISQQFSLFPIIPPKNLLHLKMFHTALIVSVAGDQALFASRAARGADYSVLSLSFLFSLLLFGFIEV